MMKVLPVSVVPVPDDRLVIHRNPLYRIMIPFDKNASLLSQSSAIMLNNYQYNLKLAWSVVSVLDWQFMIRRGMVNNLNELIDLNMRVNVNFSPHLSFYANPDFVVCDFR